MRTPRQQAAAEAGGALVYVTLTPSAMVSLWRTNPDRCEFIATFPSARDARDYPKSLDWVGCGSLILGSAFYTPEL